MTRKENDMANSYFKKGSGAYHCSECDKLTRDTGNGEGPLRLCLHCMDVLEYVNSINDGDMTLDDVPEDIQNDVKKYL
jgi:hypothetical protein